MYMTMNLDRKSCEALIERLADKTLSFGCVLRSYNPNLGYPEHVYCGQSLLNDDCYTAKLKDGVCAHMSNTGIGEEREVFIVGHPIMLTDVLEKAYGQIFMQGEAHFLQLWSKCGFTSALQTILQKAEWEVAGGTVFAIHPDLVRQAEEILGAPHMKGPAAELFAYLETLFPNESN